LLTVRLNAAEVLEGSTFGHRSPNKVATASASVSAVPAKAQPSRPRNAAATAPSRAAAARPAVTSVAGLPWLTWVASRKAAASGTAATAMRSAARRARSLSSPAVRRLRKIAPCSVNRLSVTSPPSRPYQLSRVSRLPVYT
jgi:hypothetical protein